MLQVHSNSEGFRSVFDNTRLHIVCAEQQLISEAGSLARLGSQLDGMPIHPDFEGVSKQLRADLEDPRQAVSPWRFSGPVDAAIRDMCLRSLGSPDAALDILGDDDSLFVGPLFYMDTEAEALRLTHELTVYRQSREMNGN